MSRTLLDSQQCTLAGPATVQGRGLFSGALATVRILPAPPDSGVVFVRTDLEPAAEIPALIDNIVSRPRWTALRAPGRGDDAIVETIEHCMAALAGLGVDNARVEIDAAELPGGDGSAGPFADAILAAGLQQQGTPRSPLVLEEPIVIAEENASLAAIPARDGPELLFELAFDNHPDLRRQLFAFRPGVDDFTRELAPARTFALHDEAMSLVSQGLCAHLSPSDSLVIGDNGPIDNGFRFPDEPARHKTLDLLGDLALVGRPVVARIVATRSGHALNQRLARALRDLTPPPASPETRRDAPALSIKQVLRLLPHRYPMALVDRVLEIDGDRRAVGVKNVTINEPFFQGHYPASPMMPGVLIVEAMSQLAGLTLNQTLEHEGKVAVLLSLERVKLRRPVTPGDQLIMEATTIRANKRFGESACRAFVQGRLVAEARVRFMMVDPEQL